MIALLITLAAICPAFGVPVSGSGYDSAWNEYTLTADGIAAVLALDASRSFWVGYDHGGFTPAYFESEENRALTLTLYTAGENANVLVGADLSDLASDDDAHLKTDLKVQTAGQRTAAVIVAAMGY